MIQLTASRATAFLSLMYAAFCERLQNPTGKADAEATEEISNLAREVLPVWGPSVPALRQCLVQILNGKKKPEAFEQLGQILKVLAVQGKGDREVPTQELELLGAIGTYFRTGSETQAAKLVKFASLSKNSYVVQRLAPKTTNQGKTKDKLTDMMLKLVGRKDTAMTPDEAAKVRETQPEQYREYLTLRREFNQAWRDAMTAYIRKSGHDKLPFKQVNEYLHLNGIEHMLPVGFTGLVDDMGRFYTEKGKLIEGVPSAVNFPSLTMNPNFGKPDGGDWVFMARRPDGSAGPYFYTSEFKKGQSKAKFAKVGELAKRIDGMRKRWLTKIQRFDIEDPQSVCAVVIELLYEFSGRIGSVGNEAAGAATYGMSTLLVKHATILPNGDITLRYKGKDGVPTVHKLTQTTPVNKLVLKAMHELLAGKNDPKARIFTVKKGNRLLPVTAAAVNQLFKASGAPPDTTVHKLRTLKGSTLFKAAMDTMLAKKKPKSEREAMEMFKKLAEQVGKALNHVRNGQQGTKVTGATALQAYIDPIVQIEYWTTVGFRVPKSLEKFDQALANA
jgi:hypothetical protein